MYHSFLIYSFTDGHLGCFQHLAIVNNAAMKIGVHRFFSIGISGFLGYNPSSGITGSKGSSILVFWRNSILFSIVAAPVYIPTNSALGFPFLHILESTCLLFGYDGHSDWREVVFHCGFNLHLSAGYWCWASFHMPMGPLYVLLGEVSVQVLCPLFHPTDSYWVPAVYPALCFGWMGNLGNTVLVVLP